MIGWILVALLAILTSVAATSFVTGLKRSFQKHSLARFISSAGFPPSDCEFSVIGGLRVPSNGWGTITVTWPVARFRICDGRVVIGPSSSALGWLLPTWTFPFTDLAKVERTGRGVRLLFQAVDAPVLFGWGQPDRILDHLEKHGVSVDREVHPSHWSTTR